MEEAISLVDIWKILAAQKKLFLGVFVAVVLFGSLFVLLQPKQYKFQQTMQIAYQVEEVKQLAAKLQSTFIPQIILSYNAIHPGKELKSDAIGVNLVVYQDTTNVSGGVGTFDPHLLTLVAQGPVKNRAIYRDFYQQILTKINEEQQEKLAFSRKSLEEYGVSLQHSISGYDQAVRSAPVVGEGGGNEQGLTNFLYATQLVAMRTMLGVDLSTMQEKLSQTKNDLFLLRPAHFLDNDLLMLPMGTSLQLLMLLVIFLGLFFAFMAVFVKAFFAKMQEETAKK